MSGPETRRLDGRCAEMARGGLVDFRITLLDSASATAEGVATDTNAMLDALGRGEATPFSFGDSKRLRARA